VKLRYHMPAHLGDEGLGQVELFEHVEHLAANLAQLRDRRLKLGVLFVDRCPPVNNILDNTRDGNRQYLARTLAGRWP